MNLGLLLAFCFKTTADLRLYLVLIEVLIDRFVRISIESSCCCCNRKLLFFRRYQSYEFLWTYWAKKQISIDNFTLLLQVTLSIESIQYTNLWTDQQAYSIDYCTGLYTYWSKQQISIDNFTYLLVTVIGIDRQCVMPIYCKNKSLFRRFIGTFWSNKQVSIDGFTHLSQEQSPILPIYLDVLVQATGINRQIRRPIEGVNRYRYAIPQPIHKPIGIFSRLLSRVWYV